MSNLNRELWLEQQEYFRTGRTLKLAFRREQLTRLKISVVRNHQRILEALRADTGVPSFEADSQVLKFILQEIETALKSLKEWTSPQKMGFYYWFIKGEQVYSPLGQVLIMGHWRDPLLSTMTPLISAMAAGNVITLLPPKETKALAGALGLILEDVFPQEYLCVVQCGDRDMDRILSHPFHHIFFAGSQDRGRHILKKAADHFTSTTLFLDGLNPCIIDKSSDLNSSVARVALGKFSGGGRSAFVPSFLAIHKAIKTEWLDLFCYKIEQFYGLHPIFGKDYSGVFPAELFQSLKSIIQREELLFGGAFDDNRKKIGPTLIEITDTRCDLLQEPFLGPILPIIEYSSEGHLMEILNWHRNPLALYLFAKDRDFEKGVLSQINFGGGCVNETLLQTKCIQLPLSGVGRSGVGQLHGLEGFQAFSHQKSLLRHTTRFDFKQRFPPYTPAPRWFQRTEL